ncbi:uncharacterized protein LOC132314383 [Cornus florida]|uniref:uncharacterized protein LOC132314383 n=1 Tax=Cornus florida TaxID=4283 RepID=UPI00289C803F|nr:uncharacterized protein LOC132314383 [Cornus florida]
MASSSQSIPVFRSIFPLSSFSSSDGEDFFEEHQKRMNAVMQLLSPERVKTFFRRHKRRYIKRDREEAAQRLFQDYFAENPIFPPEMFRRRFRMRRKLFIHILNGITAYDEWFIQKPDAPVQKMRAAIHILAYGISADLCDEYIKISETTAVESLKRFCDTVIAVYAGQYQRTPNKEDIARLLREEEERGFPGMLGSIDCMHWVWKNCPIRWHGTHEGRNHKPTLILKALASKNLWIWHALFGMAGSNNDVNVLDHSPVFNSMINGTMPPINYEVNGYRHTIGYYLSDSIYPKWATLI